VAHPGPKELDQRGEHLDPEARSRRFASEHLHGLCVHLALGDDQDVGARSRRNPGQVVMGALDRHPRDAPPAQVRVVVEERDRQISAVWIGQHRLHQLLAVAPSAEDDHSLCRVAVRASLAFPVQSDEQPRADGEHERDECCDEGHRPRDERVGVQHVDGEETETHQPGRGAHADRITDRAYAVPPPVHLQRPTDRQHSGGTETGDHRDTSRFDLPEIQFVPQHGGNEQCRHPATDVEHRERNPA
jgi:hypothetical protein